jgi:hypothetical protein
VLAMSLMLRPLSRACAGRTRSPSAVQPISQAADAARTEDIRCF